MKKVLLVCCCLALIGSVSAQRRSVTGKVTDGSVKGTTNGTATDADGSYSISVSDTDVLTFSFIGYESKEVTVGTQTSINVQMPVSTQTLSEVVVIGYGEREKKDVTGAISTVGSDLVFASAK